MLKKLFLWLIRFYQKYISPGLPKTCRFYPTCSQYAYDAIVKYGAVKGCFLGLLRLLRCNPLFKGGFDPLR